MEGVGEDEPITFPRHTPVAQTILKLIVDPIDGTRCLMYDKRSGWVAGRRRAATRAGGRA